MGGSGLFVPKSHPNKFWKRAIIEFITLLTNETAGELSTAVTVMQSGVDVAVANAGSAAMVDARTIASIIDKIFFIKILLKILFASKLHRLN